MRVVLLCDTTLTGFGQRVVEGLLADEELSVVGCAIDVRPKLGARVKLVRNLKRGRGGYVVVMAANMLRARLGGTRRGGRSCVTAQLVTEHGVGVVCIDDTGDAGQVGELERLAPDALVLINGFGIVKEPLLSLAPHGVLSYHHGDMRRYRGMPPAFWELYHDETEMGVTVQRLSPGLDDGAPVVEKRFAIEPSDTLETLERRVFDGSVEMMREALRAVADASEPPSRLASYGQVYTLPNLRQWLLFKLRMARRRRRGRRGGVA